MTRWIFGALALALVLRLMGPAIAADNYVVRDGNGNALTMKSKDVGGGVQSPQSVPSDAAGNPYSAANPFAVQGNAASGSADSGNPLKIGGAFNTTQPTVTNGQRVDAQMTSRGALIVGTGADTFNVTCVSGCTATTSQLASGDGLAATSLLAIGPVYFNGATWDRARAATADGLAATGIPGHAPLLWNGATFDRWREVGADGLAAAGIPALGQYLWDPTSSSWDRRYAAPGTTGVAAVSTEGTKATYSQCPATNPSITAVGDIAVLQGSGSKTIRVVRVEWTGTITSAITGTLQLVRRSTADSGGSTTAADTVAKLDSANPAPTATVTYYTTPPTSGTSAGTIRRALLTIPASGQVQAPLVWEFSNRNDQSIVLRGTSQFLAFNTNISAAGNSQPVCFTWTEE